MNLSSVIDSFADSVTVLRGSSGNWTSNGVYASTPHSQESTCIDAVVLPVSGRALEAVPSGLRGIENKQFITKDRLYTAGSDGHDSDVIIHGDARYRVHTVTDWSHAGFWIAIGAREEDS